MSKLTIDTQYGENQINKDISKLPFFVALFVKNKRFYSRAYL